jgi:hypothetical protein
MPHPTAEILKILTGIDHSPVQDNVLAIDRGFAEMNEAVDELLAAPEKLSEELRHNRFAYADHQPYAESVFLFFDLAPSLTLQS